LSHWIIGQSLAQHGDDSKLVEVRFTKKNKSKRFLFSGQLNEKKQFDSIRLLGDLDGRRDEGSMEDDQRWKVDRLENRLDSGYREKNPEQVSA
jgi:hypothetical protein